jgi:hypothetical protein
MEDNEQKTRNNFTVAAFIVGGISGGWSIANMSKRLIYLQETEEAATDVALLNRIRSKNITNAVDVLETKLDISLARLGSDFKDIPKTDRVNVLKTIQMAKDYRDKFPQKNAFPGLNQAISNAFSLVETNK